MDQKIGQLQEDDNFSGRVGKTRNSLMANGPPEFVIKSFKSPSQKVFKSYDTTPTGQIIGK